MNLYKYYSQVISNLKENGLKVTIQKIYRYINIRLTRRFTLNQRSLDNWETLKGKYAGERVFLIGNGPSLNKTPLYLLKGEFTMCFNRFNVMFERLNWLPTFYMNIDPLVAEDMKDEINDIVPQVELAFFPDIHTHGLDFRKFINDAENIQWMFPQYKDFYFDLPRVALGGTVAYPALQVLTYLGFKEIILIGVDMNYKIHTTAQNLGDDGKDISSTKDDDPNHFDPRYFGKDRKYHQPMQNVVNNIMNSFNFAADKIRENTSTSVYNAGYQSKVECFDKVNFDDLFEKSDELKFKLFSSSFSNYFTFDSFEELVSTVPHILDRRDIVDTLEIFSCDQDLGVSLIKELIFKYIPFGPFNNIYIFILRLS